MNRFHNKYHRHNHHTNPTTGEPDSSHDPIASSSDPFQGDFYLNGTLSASGSMIVQGDINVGGGLTAANLFSTGMSGIEVEKIYVNNLSTTSDLCLKIDIVNDTYPIIEAYHNSNPVMYLTKYGLGINTSTPITSLALDVIGDTRVGNLTANNIALLGTSFTSGYIELGYTSGGDAWIRDISGTNIMRLGTGPTSATDNFILYPDGTNMITGELGIGMSSLDTLSVSGNIGLYNAGSVLLDNTYSSVLRLITNNSAAVEADRHKWAFDETGKVIHGDISLSAVYADDYNTVIAPYKHNIIDNRNDGRLLSLNNTSDVTTGGARIDFFRSRGEVLGILDGIATQDIIGSIAAHGAWERGYTRDSLVVPGGSNLIPSAKIDFIAANDFTDISRGAYISLHTTDRDNINVASVERVRIHDNGFVGVNTISAISGIPEHRLHVRETVSSIDLQRARDVIAVDSINDEAAIAIHADDRAFTGRIYTQASDRTLVIGSNTDQGSILFEVNGRFDVGGTNNSRRRDIITYEGDIGHGTTSPQARMHIRDDDGAVDSSVGSSTRGNIMILETESTTNGILLTAYNPGTAGAPVNPFTARIYTDRTTDALCFSTHESKDFMQFKTADNLLAMTITKYQNVNIGFTADTDVLTYNYDDEGAANTRARLAVNGNVIIGNSTTAINSTYPVSGAKLYFASSIAHNNGSDPTYIYRYDKLLNRTDLRVNVGNNTCFEGSSNADTFSIGTHLPTNSITVPAGTAGAWEPWLDVGACSSKFTGNLEISGNTTVRGNIAVTGTGTNTFNGAISSDSITTNTVNVSGTLTTTNIAVTGTLTVDKLVVKDQVKVVNSETYISPEFSYIKRLASCEFCENSYAAITNDERVIAWGNLYKSMFAINASPSPFNVKATENIRVPFWQSYDAATYKPYGGDWLDNKAADPDNELSYKITDLQWGKSSAMALVVPHDENDVPLSGGDVWVAGTNVGPSVEGPAITAANAEPAGLVRTKYGNFLVAETEGASTGYGTGRIIRINEEKDTYKISEGTKTKPRDIIEDRRNSLTPALSAESFYFYCHHNGGTNNGYVRRMNYQGESCTVAGIPLSSSFIGEETATISTAFDQPEGLAMTGTPDGSGDYFLYVCDNSNAPNKKIYYVNLTTNKVVATIGTGAVGLTDGTHATAQFTELKKIAIDPTDDNILYITDSNRVRRIYKTGTTTWRVDTISNAANTAGSTNGTVLLGGGTATFYAPAGIKVSNNGKKIYVADTGVGGTIANQCIRRIIVTTNTTAAFTGTTDSYITSDKRISGSMNQAHGTTRGPNGELYIADAINNRIRKLEFNSLTGYWDLSTYAGDGRATSLAAATSLSASFNNPVGITYSSYDNSLYVTCHQDHVIMRIDMTTGACTVVAGKRAVRGHTENITGTNALLSYPTGITYGEINGKHFVWFREVGICGRGRFGVLRRIQINPVSLLSPVTYPVITLNNIALCNNFNAGIGGQIQNAGITPYGSLHFYKDASTPTNKIHELYLAEADSHCIKKVALTNNNKTDIISLVAGVPGVAGSTNGSSASTARFNYPVGVTHVGNILYINDRKNHKIRKITDFRNSDILRRNVDDFAGSGSPTIPPRDGNNTGSDIPAPNYGITPMYDTLTIGLAGITINSFDIEVTSVDGLVGGLVVNAPNLPVDTIIVAIDTTNKILTLSNKFRTTTDPESGTPITTLKVYKQLLLSQGSGLRNANYIRSIDLFAPYKVTTLEGSFTNGYSDTVYTTNAWIPYGLFIDSADNLHFTDRQVDQIGSVLERGAKPSLNYTSKIVTGSLGVGPGSTNSSSTAYTTSGFVRVDIKEVDGSTVLFKRIQMSGDDPTRTIFAALDTQDSLWVWGYSVDGAFGLGPTGTIAPTKLYKYEENILDFGIVGSLNGFSVINIITKDNKIHAAGDNSAAQLARQGGIRDTNIQTNYYRVFYPCFTGSSTSSSIVTNAKKVARSSVLCRVGNMYISTSDTVYACGYAPSGILGKGAVTEDLTIDNYFNEIGGLTNVVDVLVAGSGSTTYTINNTVFALTSPESGGKVYAWGYNDTGTGIALVGDIVSEYITSPTACKNQETNNDVENARYIFTTNHNANPINAMHGYIDNLGYLYLGGYKTDTNPPTYLDSTSSFRRFNMRNVTPYVVISSTGDPEALAPKANGTVYRTTRWGPQKLF